jgi:hypothetical protein
MGKDRRKRCERDNGTKGRDVDNYLNVKERVDGWGRQKTIVRNN